MAEPLTKICPQSPGAGERAAVGVAAVGAVVDRSEDDRLSHGSVGDQLPAGLDGDPRTGAELDDRAGLIVSVTPLGIVNSVGTS